MNTEPHRTDPLADEIEAALCPGDFIPYHAVWSFVEEVQRVADEIATITSDEPVRAERLYRLFIGACHEKAEEIDDSGDGFGALVGDLFRGWVTARQGSHGDPDETAAALIASMEDDPYGYCSNLEKRVIEVLDVHGAAAFARQLRGKVEAVSTDGEDSPRSKSARRRWEKALKTVLAAQVDVDGYIALCDRTGIEATDCIAVATMYDRLRRPEVALEWVERGLTIARADDGAWIAKHDLRILRREVLVKVGRTEDSLQSAWTEFAAHPSTFTYDELMRYVPGTETSTWHHKAMRTAEHGDPETLIDLLSAHQEIDRLVSFLRRLPGDELERLSHHRMEPLARELERTHPDLAAGVYRALCMRIVNAGKSKYYDAALLHIERAKKCYLKVGLDAAWQAVVEDVRTRHFRKKGFMARFEAIVAGAPKAVEPSFMERARARGLSKFRN